MHLFVCPNLDVLRSGCLRVSHSELAADISCAQGVTRQLPFEAARADPLKSNASDR